MHYLTDGIGVGARSEMTREEAWACNIALGERYATRHWGWVRAVLAEYDPAINTEPDYADTLEPNAAYALREALAVSRCNKNAALVESHKKWNEGTADRWNKEANRIRISRKLAR